MNQVKVYVCSVSVWDLPENAVEFLNFWWEKLREIPEEYFETAEIKGDFSEWSNEYTISYTRPETEEETAAREEQETRSAAYVRNAEYKKYLELKRKFEVE